MKIGHHGREHEKGRGEPGGRFIRRGDVQLVLLQLLSEKSMHGYEMIKALEEKSAGFYKPSPGSVYPTLQMLEDQGFIESAKNERKKVFEITEEGRAHLAAGIGADFNSSDLFAGLSEERHHHGNPHEHAHGQHHGHHHDHGDMDDILRGRIKHITHMLFAAGRGVQDDSEGKRSFDALLGALEKDLDRFVGEGALERFGRHGRPGYRAAATQVGSAVDPKLTKDSVDHKPAEGVPAVAQVEGMEGDDER